MALFYENFSKGVQGQPFPGFTTKISRSGDSVTLSNDISQGNFLNVFKGGTNGSLVVAWDVLNNKQDVELLARFRTGGASPTLGRYGILYGRYEGSSEATTKGYAATFTPAASTPSIIINEDSFGTVHFKNYSWANNQIYWARFRVVGNQQQFKIWADGSTEPSTWFIDGVYAGPSIASPYSGLGSYNSWGNIQVFQLSAATDGDTAPTTQQQYIDYLNSLVPQSTPLGVIGGGYGGIGGYGSAYGHGTQAAFTVEHLDQTGNARIERVESTTISGDARIERVVSTTQVGNARIRRTLNVTRIGNARIEKALSIDQPGDARIEQINSLDQQGNATIESFFFAASVDQEGNARIQRTESLQQSGNARVERVESLSQVGNAFIEWQLQISQQGNAAIILQRSLDQSGDAFIELARSISQTGNAFIEWQLQVVQTGNARIERVRQITQVGNATIIRVDSVTQIGNARIERISSIVQIGNATITNPSPDKRPQQWIDSDPEAPAAWTEEERMQQAWAPAEDKAEAAWENTEDQQPQQWSDSDKPQPTEWQRQYYD